MVLQNEFLESVLDLMALGSELSYHANKGKEHFAKYCMENKEEILKRISLEDKSTKRNYESLLKSPIIKNNFSELSDYVRRYYDETKRTQ